MKVVSVQQLLRFQGNRGTAISPHRSIATIPLARGDIVLTVVLSLGFSGGIVIAFGTIANAWTSLFAWLAAPLGFPGVAGETVRLGALPSFELSHFIAAAAPPSSAIWWTTVIVCVVLLLLSFAMRGALLPMAYVLRLAVLIQSTALVFFRVHAWHFPYDLSAYITSMLSCGLVALALVPIVLGLTYYLIDVALVRKIVLTILVCGHLLLFIPLQYAIQSYAIVHGSLLFLPLCFTLLGLLPEVLIFIALYGWGMSWPARGHREMRE